MREIRRYSSPLLELVPAFAAELIVTRALKRALRQQLARENLASLYLSLARIEQRRRRFGAAEELLKKALLADPALSAMYRFEIACLCTKRGDYTQALSHLVAAKAELPEDVSESFRSRLESDIRQCVERTHGGNPVP